ncbi:MAG: insulinase family protein [Phycisphaerales bacterium]|nr:MAG: insulinase family protein [Phycisphaerales bacterium]
MEHDSYERRLWIVAVGLLLIVASWPATARGEDRSPAPKGVQPREVTLENGLTILLVERHEQPTVACGLFFDVGGANDPQGKSGIAHLFEHMMFKGSMVIGTSDYKAERSYLDAQDKLRAKMNAEMDKMRLMKRRGGIDDVLDPKQWTPDYAAMKKQYDELVEAERTYIKKDEFSSLYTTNGGARLNAGTMEDATMYFVQLPANKLELFFWMESDRMVNGIMREFYVERDNVREERRLGVESTPTGKYNEAFDALFWQSHPYGVPVIGWASEVESITRDDVRDFYRIYYAPNNARMVLVGDFDSDKAVEMAKRYFGRLPRGIKEPPPVITEEPKPIAERRLHAEAETNPRVRMRYHTTAIGHTDEAALDVLAQLLSGKTGRLYKRLVTTEDAAIGEPRVNNQGRKYAGYFEVNVTVKEDRTPEEVEQFVLEELDKLRDGEITDHELQKVKNQVLATSVRRLRSNLGLMFQLGLYDTWYDWSYINEAPERMLKVTADDVRRVVKDYFDPKTRTVAIYRTKGGAPTEGEDPELAAILEKLSPQQRDRTKAMIKRIRESTDLDRLKPMLQMMEQGASSDQIPEEQKMMFEYVLKVLSARVAELEAADKESD